MAAVARAIHLADWLRRSPAQVGGAVGHKEWLHFCVYGRTVDLLVNFSVLDDVQPPVGPVAEFARTTLLVREETWRGEVHRHPQSDVQLQGGNIALRFGSSAVRFVDNAYLLSARFAEQPITIECRLEPITMPSIIHNVQVGDGPPINWLVVPRLVASGRVTIAGRVHDLDGALAYHDHNWGHFGWGRDFAWEWGYGLPEDPANPWTLVFVRLRNRAHTRTMMQGAFLWKAEREQRVFRDRELTVRHHGFLRAARPCKIPGVMGLIHPQTATDVPAELLFTGASEGDTLEATFRGADVAQVIVPNDRDLGVTVINEVSGRLVACARVRGERVQIDGRAIFEFLGA